jgi:hypothetical protein
MLLSDTKQTASRVSDACRVEGDVVESGCNQRGLIVSAITSKNDFLGSGRKPANDLHHGNAARKLEEKRARVKGKRTATIVAKPLEMTSIAPDAGRPMP